MADIVLCCTRPRLARLDVRAEDTAVQSCPGRCCVSVKAVTTDPIDRNVLRRRAVTVANLIATRRRHRSLCEDTSCHTDGANMLQGQGGGAVVVGRQRW